MVKSTWTFLPKGKFYKLLLEGAEGAFCNRNVCKYTIKRYGLGKLKGVLKKC